MMNNNLYNKDFRQKLLVNPKKAMSELNSELINDVDVVVKKNTSDTIYFVMPDHGTLEWDGDRLDNVNAAGTSSCASTTGTVGSVSSATSTLGSVGSLSSAGTAGSK